MRTATFRAHIANSKLPQYCREIDSDCPLDRWISFAVKVLRDGGVETFESCQGGPDHSFPEPTVRFFGNSTDGLRAVAVAAAYGLPVRSVRRFWSMIDGELTGPQWEMTFAPLSALQRRQRDAERARLI